MSAHATTDGTVKARPITFAEIEALAQRDATSVPVYLAEESRRHGFTLTPATLTPEPKTGRDSRDAEVPHHVIYAAVPNPAPRATNRWKEDRDQPLGHVVSCSTETMFGTNSGVHLFTTPAAEDTAGQAQGWRDPSGGRVSIWVGDAKGGSEERLTPVFGAQVSTGFVVEGLTAEEARSRAEAALRAEFGDTLRPHFKVQSRPVPDRRVNVFSLVDRTPLALNVLSSEVSYYMNSSAVDVEEVDPAAPQIDVG